MSKQANNPQQELSPEEIKARKEEMLAFYDNEIPFLEKRAKYEMLLADIDEARTRRLMANVQMASMMTGPESEEKDGKRQLKKDPK